MMSAFVYACTHVKKSTQLRTPLELEAPVSHQATNKVAERMILRVQCESYQYSLLKNLACAMEVTLCMQYGS